MKKFIVIYSATAEAMKEAESTPPEENKESMEKWMTWAKSCGSGLVDMGSPLGNGQKITQSGSSPVEKMVVGYSILQAENMEGAKSLLKNHPHLSWNADCNIEIHECMPMPEHN
jgi:hypothetical protein